MPVPIKTYTHPHQQGPPQSQEPPTVVLKRMEHIYARHQGRPDEPHRHDYYTILLVETARGQHHIDFAAYELMPLQVYFVAPGQVHQLVETAPSRGFALTFSEAFLTQNNIPTRFIADINLFHDYGAAPPLPLSTAAFAELVGLVEGMERYLDSNSPFRLQAAGAYLKLFLIACQGWCTQRDIDNPQTLQAGHTILREFKAWVERDYATQHTVGYYAEQLAVTPDHLNKTIKSLIGKSAKEYIQSRLVIAAKRRLWFGDESAKEIAFGLGFQDPAHFSRFFKNCTGQSVSDFRASRV